MHPDVDTVIVTGGRGSGKSFGVGLAVVEGMIQSDWKALYTRFTNVSAKDSIIPEVAEKIEILGYGEHVNSTTNRVESLAGDGMISFKGLKTGSKGQTANLKSLSGFNVWVVDEAEEIPDFETFDKIYLSIRSTEKRNLSILLLNPASKEHWIHETFFEDRDVEAGFNGIVGNVLYIHTSYEDVNPKYIAKSVLRRYNEMSVKEPDKYENIVQGGWLDNPEGVLFPKKELNLYDAQTFRIEQSEGSVGYIDVADQGDDSLAFPIGQIVGNKIFIWDVVYTKEGIEVTLPLCAGKINDYAIDFIRAEANSMGAMFARDLAKLVEQTTVQTIHSKANKHTRIMMQSGFIKEHFKFRSNYEKNSDYGRFMKSITHYMKDGSTKTDDDAPDAIAGLAMYVRSFLPHLWEIEED